MHFWLCWVIEKEFWELIYNPYNQDSWDTNAIARQNEGGGGGEGGIENASPPRCSVDVSQDVLTRVVVFSFALRNALSKKNLKHV